jgi:hypothetical protein
MHGRTAILLRKIVTSQAMVRLWADRHLYLLGRGHETHRQTVLKLRLSGKGRETSAQNAAFPARLELVHRSGTWREPGGSLPSLILEFAEHDGKLPVFPGKLIRKLRFPHTLYYFFKNFSLFFLSVQSNRLFLKN